jgi:hypothetical protein
MEKNYAPDSKLMKQLEENRRLHSIQERIIKEAGWSPKEKEEIRRLNPPEWYKKMVDITRLTNGDADKFITQAQATIKLAEKCELHPFLHSFIDLNDLRESVEKKLNQSGQLYASGTAEKFLIDSAFDEIIDTIVENWGKCK